MDGFSNSLLIQYGNIPSWAGSASVTLPTSYSNTYTITLSYNSNGAPLSVIFYRNPTMTTFMIYQRDYGYESPILLVSWQTMGY